MTCVEQMLIGKMDIVAGQSLSRAYQWRYPFNWTRPQWWEEISSEAALAVIELSRVTTLDMPTDITRCQNMIQNRLLKHYRRELAFNKYCGQQIDNEPTALQDPQQGEVQLDLQMAMNRLPARDRLLIQQLYWEKRTESQIAAEAGVSVPAICKRKKRILCHLRNILKKY